MRHDCYNNGDLQAMIDNAINDDKVIAASGKGAIPTGRYYILEWLGMAV